jgi:hypothetical protein
MSAGQEAEAQNTHPAATHTRAEGRSENTAGKIMRKICVNRWRLTRADLNFPAGTDRGILNRNITP